MAVGKTEPRRKTSAETPLGPARKRGENHFPVLLREPEERQGGAIGRPGGAAVPVRPAADLPRRGLPRTEDPDVRRLVRLLLPCESDGGTVRRNGRVEFLSRQASDRHQAEFPQPVAAPPAPPYPQRQQRGGGQRRHPEQAAPPPRRLPGRRQSDGGRLLLDNLDRTHQTVAPAWKGLDVPGLALLDLQHPPDDGDVLNDVGFFDDPPRPEFSTNTRSVSTAFRVRRTSLPSRNTILAAGSTVNGPIRKIFRRPVSGTGVIFRKFLEFLFLPLIVLPGRRN